MKLFSSTQISWNEPWFFILRIRQAWGWRQRVLLALAISVLMFLAIFFFGGGRLGTAGAIGISLAAGFLLVALLDMANIQREVTVKDDCILVNSATGWGWTWAASFKLEDITDVQLLRPVEDWDKPYGGMVINTASDGFLVAVPRKVSLETLANILHRLGVSAVLVGWEPSQSDTRIGVRDQVELDPSSAQGQIEIRPVEAAEGPLLGPAHVAVQVVIALGPLLLALIGAVLAGVALYRNWAEMSWLVKGLYAGGALLGLVVAFMYLVMIGQFVAAAYGIRVARGKLQTRTKALFAGTEDDLVCVEIFDRANWTATISKSSDYGFLRIERPRARLLFEGNKTRWTLPTSALTACRIEESLVGSEANPTEKRYFVVLQAASDGQPWEAGLLYTRTELGSDTAESRYKRAQLLFAQLAAVVQDRVTARPGA